MTRRDVERQPDAQAENLGCRREITRLQADVELPAYTVALGRSLIGSGSPTCNRSSQALRPATTSNKFKRETGNPRAATCNHPRHRSDCGTDCSQSSERTWSSR